jgi:DNA modification methylase
MIKILHGDCIESLKSLEDQSVNTCITSPPYWGLRDYGTAEWEGGDEDCDHTYHVPSPYNKNFNERWGNPSGNRKQESERHNVEYKKECKKCGAIRKDKQLGMEDTPEEFTENLVKVFREVKRVLRDDGTLWLNLGDSYSSGGRTTTTNQSLRGDKEYGVTRPKPSKGIKPKDLIGIPWRVAFALQQDGWYLRQDIIWHKPAPMPESVKDRCTKAHEYIFLLSKNKKYYYDNEAIKEDCVSNGVAVSPNKIKAIDSVFGSRDNIGKFKGSSKRNKRSVWTITTKPFKGAHFATFPKDLIEPCVLAGCPEGGTVLDPFGGSGTTGIVAAQHDRNAVLLELNKEYIELAQGRIEKEMGMFAELKVEMKDD